jgi:plasmid replication initiation protein
VKRSRLVVVSDEYLSPQDLKLDPVAAGIAEAMADWAPIEAPDGLLSSKPDKRSSLRMLMVLMERPFFALSKRRLDPLHYLSPDGTIRIQVDPGPDGMATIYDADLVMFLVKELAEAPAGSNMAVVLKGAAYLRTVGAKNGGDQYALLAKAIRRLSTTRVTTNADPDGKPGPTRSFCWFEQAARRGNDWHVTVPAWLKEGARSKFVLDVCPEYFDLKGGFDRLLYLTSRKHVGRERGKVFQIKLSTLWRKSGSGGKVTKFRHEIKSITTKNQLPEYWLELKAEPRQDGLLLIRRR